MTFVKSLSSPTNVTCNFRIEQNQQCHNQKPCSLSPSSRWLLRDYGILWIAVVVGITAVFGLTLLSTSFSESFLISQSQLFRDVTPSLQRIQPYSQTRQLTEVVKGQIPPQNLEKEDDSDSKSDEVCRKYLLNFLNGTTDFRDECDGFANAYRAADCYKENIFTESDDIEPIESTMYFNLQKMVAKKKHYENGTTTDDDVMIDDAFENFACCKVISGFYEKHCAAETISSINPSKLLGIVMVLVTCGLVKSGLRYAKVQFIPDAGACIAVGAVFGLISKLLQKNANNTDDNELSFDNDLFLRILLPPIIFEASLTIDKRSFRRDLFPILTFSIVGTAMSAILVGYGTHYICNHVWQRGIPIPLLDSLLFGALMSSIDPVATLSILAGVGMEQSDPLYTLIFGESLLNDGVAIVLFDSLVEHMGDSDVVDAASFHDTIGDFIIVSGGSILIGCVCGACATMYFWLLQQKQNDVTEVALFFSWALVPYYIADKYNFSGIISIMVMGFIMDYYVIGGNIIHNSSHMSQNHQWMEYMEMRHRQRQQQHQGSNSNIMSNNSTGMMSDQSNRIGGNSNGSTRFTGPVDGLNPSTTTTPIRSDTIERGNWSLHCLDREQIMEACQDAFSGRGHLMNRSKHHVGFVAEVIANIMETSIFAYLGLFLFNDRHWNFKLMTSGLFSCIASRAVMVISLSLIINICVFINLEQTLGKIFKAIRVSFRQLNNSNNNSRTYRSGISSGSGSSNYLLGDADGDEDEDIDEDAVYPDYPTETSNNNHNNKKQYLNAKMQMILFSAGIRGAVSYALVQNIPVYDAVTKTGSHYKGELRTMTSVTIMVLLFVFGAMTFFTVTKSPSSSSVGESDGNGNNEHPQQHPYRLLASNSSVLDSFMDNDNDANNNGVGDDIHSLLLEASREERRRRPHLNESSQQQQQQQQKTSHTNHHDDRALGMIPDPYEQQPHQTDYHTFTQQQHHQQAQVKDSYQPPFVTQTSSVVQ